MQREILRIFSAFVLAAIVWPAFGLAQECLPQRLSELAMPDEYHCAANSRLTHRYSDHSEAEFYNNSHAILIFQQDYSDDAWRITSEGARLAEDALASALSEKGFNLFIWRNLDYVELDLVIREGLRTLGNDELSRLFFYYYGHGLNIPGRGFHFIPVDGVDPVENDADSGYVRYEFLRASFDMVDARHAFYAFEGCNAGAIFERLSPIDTRPIMEPIELRTTDALQPQRQYLTATDASGTAPANGDFAVAIASALSDSGADLNQDGYIVGKELIAKVKLQYEITGRSRPRDGYKADGSNGEIIFGRTGPPRDEPLDEEPRPIIDDRIYPDKDAFGENDLGGGSSFEGIRVLYFKKPADGSAIDDVLARLNIDAEIGPAGNDVPTSLLTCTTDVPGEKIRLLALALYDQGVRLKRINVARTSLNVSNRISLESTERSPELHALTRAEIESLDTCRFLKSAQDER